MYHDRGRSSVPSTVCLDYCATFGHFVGVKIGVSMVASIEAMLTLGPGDVSSECWELPVQDLLWLL
jgi:hypothetical protein